VTQFDFNYIVYKSS